MARPSSFWKDHLGEMVGKRRMQFDVKPVLTGMVLLGLGILISLGTWQWNKIDAKTSQIAQIKEGLSQPAKPLEDVLREVAGGDLSYRRVEVEGRFIKGEALRLAGTDRIARSGYHLYGVFQTGFGDRIVTSTGWVPFNTTDFPSLPAGTLKVTGVLMGPGSKGSFTPPNNADTNNWYWADLPAMAAVFGETNPVDYRLILDDLGDGLPIGGQVRVDIPNDHFEYALTWYGLALTLLGVYLAFSIKRQPDQGSI